MAKISCCDCCYYHLPKLERPNAMDLTRSILDAGFDGVDLGMWGPLATFNSVEKPDLKAIKAVAKLVDDFDKEVTSLQIGDLHLGKIDFAVNRLKRSLEYAQIMKCKGIVVCVNMEDIKPFDVLNKMGVIFDEVIPLFREKGCWLGFENHCNEIFWAHRTAEDMMITARFLEKRGVLDVTGLVPDSSHFIRAFSDYFEAFRQCLPYSKMLHLKDATEEAFVSIGKGIVDFDVIFKLAKENSFNGIYALEMEFEQEIPDVPTELKKSYAYIKSLTEKYSL